MLATIDNKTVIKHLNELIRLDYDTIAAYSAAIDHLRDTTVTDKLQEYKLDHERHVRSLQEKVRAMGGKPKCHGDVKQLMLRGKVLFANLRGENAILAAMKSTEDLTNRAYEQALEQLRGVEGLDTLLQRNLQDERIHRAWLENPAHPPS